MGKQTYTVEQEKWIVNAINNNKYMRTTDFVCSYNKEFNTNKTWNLLKDKIDRLGLSHNMVKGSAYTDLEKKWISENFNKFTSVNDALVEFNKTFNTNKSIGSFRAIANNKLKLKRSVKTIKQDAYTDEQTKWLINVCQNRVYSGLSEIVVEFNKEFGTNKTRSAIQAKISNLGLYAKKTHFTEEEVLWISGNKDKDSWDNLSKVFSEKFGRNITGEQLKHAANRKGFHKIDPYKSCDIYEIGDEKIERNGHVYVKVGYARNINPKTTHPDREVYRPKGRMVWEKHFGEIPEGHQIAFIDGDKTNCDISNLQIIPLGVSGIMTSNGFWKIENSELRKTALMYSQLAYEIKRK